MNSHTQRAIEALEACKRAFDTNILSDILNARELANEALSLLRSHPAAPQQGEGDPVGDTVTIPREVFDYLKGTGPLEGLHFGEPHKDFRRRGKFWWRKHLVPSPAPEPSGISGQLDDPAKSLSSSPGVPKEIMKALLHFRERACTYEFKTTHEAKRCSREIEALDEVLMRHGVFPYDDDPLARLSPSKEPETHIGKLVETAQSLADYVKHEHDNLLPQGAKRLWAKELLDRWDAARSSAPKEPASSPEGSGERPRERL